MACLREAGGTGRGVCRAQMARMLRMIVALGAGRFPNAADLATAAEVSRRTVHRDLDALLAAGVPVRYRPEHRGYDLAPGFFLPPIALDEAEALALAVHAHLPSPEGGPDLRAEARSGLLKVLAALPEPTRSRIVATIASHEPGLRRGAALGRWAVDSGDAAITMGLAVNERAHSSVG